MMLNDHKRILYSFIVAVYSGMGGGMIGGPFAGDGYGYGYGYHYPSQYAAPIVAPAAPVVSRYYQIICFGL